MPDSLGHETLETVGTCYTPLANNGWYANSEGPKAEFYYVQGPGQYLIMVSLSVTSFEGRSRRVGFDITQCIKLLEKLQSNNLKSIKCNLLNFLESLSQGTMPKTTSQKTKNYFTIYLEVIC